MPRLETLIVDDDEDFRTSLEHLARREGYATRGAASLAEARRALSEAVPDVVMIDLKLPDGSGLDLLQDDASESCDLIVITGNATVDTAVSALRDGALDYLTKPIDRTRLKTVLGNVARTRELKREVGDLRRELRELGRFGRIVGRSKGMQQVYDLVARVAPTDATVFITGESGTGKEVVAETLHELSSRRRRPFLAVNCGAVSPTLIESELFGHERGSFTGADRRREGYFEQADGGTLFLDEITEMPIELQVKLLRVLETGKVTRVGSGKGLEVNVRVVAATNRPPEDAMREGKLREDLYYRLNVFPINLPPLRERPEDVELLAVHFLEELNREHGTAKRWHPRALNDLESRPWIGNVRELRNAVQRAFIMSDEEIGPAAIAGTPIPEAAATADGDDGGLSIRPGSTIASMEKRLILATLEEFEGDKKRAAKALGISLKTLYNRLAVYRARTAD